MRRRKLYEFTRYISPDGDQFVFDSYDRFMISEGGLGMPPIEYVSQRGPFQHGQSFIDYRLGSRVIQYLIRENGCSRQEYWDNRQRIINMFRPNRGNGLELGKLRKILPDGTMRDIDVVLESGPVFESNNSGRWDQFAYTEALRFIAEDPTFYDPTQVVVNMTASSATNSLSFPMTFDFVFDANIIEKTQSVTYNGSWLSYPQIVMTGPLTGATITNQTTGEMIKTNYVIPVGGTVTISLDFGNKTVIDNNGVNLIGIISDDSDLSTFHLEPSPNATGGVNTFFTFAAGATIGTSKIEIKYYTRYIGL